ncbi:unnamed protein product, partial [Linum tenue]
IYPKVKGDFEFRLKGDSRLKASPTEGASRDLRRRSLRPSLLRSPSLTPAVASRSPSLTPNVASPISLARLG